MAPNYHRILMPRLNVFIIDAAQWCKSVEPPAPWANFVVQKTPENLVFGEIYKMSLPLLPLPKADFRSHLGMRP